MERVLTRASYLSLPELGVLSRLRVSDQYNRLRFEGKLLEGCNVPESHLGVTGLLTIGAISVSFSGRIRIC
jgi:hypothetical protein